MTRASFEFKDPKSPRVIMGTVTKSTYGKVTISLFQPRQYAAFMRYKAKQLAKEIVAADFKHPAVKQLIGGKLDKLVDILKKETESLKKQYLQFTEEWAKKAFARMEEKMKWTTQEWYDSYSIKYTMKEIMGKMSPEIDFKEMSRNDVMYKTMIADQRQCRSIVPDGYAKYLKDELYHAECHYLNSIEKLAWRIDQKGLKQDNLTVKNSHIGVNINTILTDGEQTVHAFTIVARGEIRRPHYRYLIK